MLSSLIKHLGNLRKMRLTKAKTLAHAISAPAYQAQMPDRASK